MSGREAYFHKTHSILVLSYLKKTKQKCCRQIQAVKYKFFRHQKEARNMNKLTPEHAQENTCSETKKDACTLTHFPNTPPSCQGINAITENYNLKHLMCSTLLIVDWCFFYYYYSYPKLELHGKTASTVKMAFKRRKIYNNL